MSLALDPTQTWAHYQRGVVLHESKQWYCIALSAYQAAIALDPKSASFYCMCGVALEKLGQHYEAERAYLQALTIDKNVKGGKERFLARAGVSYETYVARHAKIYKAVYQEELFGENDTSLFRFFKKPSRMDVNSRLTQLVMDYVAYPLPDSLMEETENAGKSHS